MTYLTGNLKSCMLGCHASLYKMVFLDLVSKGEIFETKEIKGLSR